MREQPVVVYQASVLGSFTARADMESASLSRHSLQAASVLPEELSATNDVEVSRGAMMGDQSLCKGGWVKPVDPRAGLTLHPRAPSPGWR